MNKEMTQIYSKIYNTEILQDFVNVNIKWLCFSNDDDVKKKMIGGSALLRDV